MMQAINRHRAKELGPPRKTPHWESENLSGTNKIFTFWSVEPNRQITRLSLKAGRQKAGRIATVDKVLSLLISVGIIAMGDWVVVATIARGSPFVWTLMALFPLLIGFISFYESMGTQQTRRSLIPLGRW